MKPFRELIEFVDAKRIIIDTAKPIDETEAIPLDNATGRVLADTITAEFDVPGFSRAAVDGYAVRAADTYGATRDAPKPLILDGVILAGNMPEKAVTEGKCIQIATGAPMPEGADAVVMVEETEIDGNRILVGKPVYPEQNVSKPDSDISTGTEMLVKGTILTPPMIGVLAALNRSEVEVYRRPIVTLVPTGEEVIPVGSSPVPGKVYDINSHTLAALIRENGGQCRVAGIAGDTEEELRAVLEKYTDSDIIAFTGGSSVGERDLLAAVVEDMGELYFHGIALKPGKPTIFGRVDKRLVLGLPGYPTSCLTNGYTLLAPMIRKMAHLPLGRRTVRGYMTKKFLSTIGRHQILPVFVEGTDVTPVFKESGAITSMSRANGYLEIPANVEFLEKGAEVEVYLY